MIAIKAGALWASLLLASSFFTPTYASPVEPQDELHAPLEPRADYYPIKGLGGHVHARLEIRTLKAKQPAQFDLYIQAIHRMQSMDQSHKLSWFQIGGIHGAPNIPWDGVQQTASGVGYCTHSMNLFPTWHRPYVALFEERLSAAAHDIANQYPDSEKAKYQAAASQLRAPYWDWAVDPPPGTQAMPVVLTSKKVTINSKDGKKTIHNPLYAYRYHPLNQGDFAPYATPWDYWKTTLRWPQDTGTDAVSHDSQAAATISSNRPGQKQGVYNWFTLCPRYLEMSNDLPSGSTGNCHISLESLHNNIHVWVGGNNDGHMTVIPVSAEDPTFMLHHCMIDRLFAMWQAIYPHSWCPNQVSNVSTFTIAQGSVQGPTSPLKPFHRNKAGDFWTSNSVRKWKVFGYTYPEFHETNGSPAAIKQVVNNLYGPNSEIQAAVLSKRLSHERDSPASGIYSSVPTPLLTAVNGSSFQYIANIATTRFGLGGSYVVYVFMGEPGSADPATWSTDSALIGSYGVFSAPDMENSNLVTTSSVALTEALIQQIANGALQGMDEVYVTPFLTKMLQWRVATSSNLEVVDAADIPDFVLSVVASTTAPLASPEDFPIWSPFKLITEITNGKPGGLPLNGTLNYGG